MKAFLFLSFLLFFNCISSQPKNLSFDNLSIENGLPENFATDIVQDKKGYIWIATPKGLARYDGYKMRVYKDELKTDSNATSAYIMSVFVDSRGSLWLVTNDHLMRYRPSTDNFIKYKFRTKEGEYTGTGKSIVEDAEHNLWLRTFAENGNKIILKQFNQQSGKFENRAINLRESGGLEVAGSYTIPFSDSRGTLWVGTNNGIYSYDHAANKFTGHFVSTDSLNRKYFSNIYESPSEPGVLYMAHQSSTAGIWKYSGIVRYDIKENKETHYYKTTVPGSILNDTIITFFEDREKNLWISTSNSLELFNRDSKSFEAFSPNDGEHENSPNLFLNISQSNSGLWLAGGEWGGKLTGKGLMHFDTKKKVFYRYVENFKKTNEVSSNNIGKIYTDNQLNTWILYLANNYPVQKINYNRSRFTAISEYREGLSVQPVGTVFGLAEAPDHSYWIVSTNGLLHYEPLKGISKIKLYEGSVRIMALHTSVAVDKEGIVWCGHDTKGLFRYDPQTKSVTNYQQDPKDSTSLSSNGVNRLLFDRKGYLWIGTFGGGVCRFNKTKKSFTRYHHLNRFDKDYNGPSLNDPLVLSLFEDKLDRLWITTVSGGLSLMNKEKGTFTSYNNPAHNFKEILKLEDAENGMLWAGSYYSGLLLFDPVKGVVVKRFTEKNGLPADGVGGMAKDADGNLWISSTRGLMRLNEKQNKFTYFTTAQGLPDNNPYALFFDSKGDMAANYKSGFFKFSVNDLKPSRILPIINLEAISYINIDNVNSHADTILPDSIDRLDLAHYQNKLTFYFTAIQFDNPTLNSYKYKLEGYDKDWIDGGQLRNATYTNLHPGTYAFYVKAANMDGIWNETPASVVIKIHSPWWTTWWAYLLYAAVFGFVIYAVISYRSRSLSLENKQLEQKIADRTSQLENSLEDLKSTQAQLVQSEKMASLGELTAGIAHEIQNPLNFINNFSEVNTELIEEMQQEISAGNKEEVIALAIDINENNKKIHHHGKRADAIVKGMLQHSRTSSGAKEPTNINDLADEYLRLSYHGLRAKDKTFNADFRTDFDQNIGKMNIIAQDIGRVFLNLINNAFYSVAEKKKERGDAFFPVVMVSTKRLSDKVKIEIEDNGNGIPAKVLEKIYQPFFTTKPTGHGTGLGLSMSYDIIKAHGGELAVETKEGEFAKFILLLPLK